MLQLICDGQSNREIAAKLDLSVEHRRRPSRQHHERARRAQDRRARGLRDAARAGAPCCEPARVPACGCGAGRCRRRRCRSPRLGAGADRRSGSGWSTSPPRRACSSATTAAPTAASCCRKRWAPAARSSTTTPTAGRTSCSSTAWTGPDTSGSARRCACIATTATARSPTSRAAPASTSSCTAWASPSATSNNDGFPDLLVTCVGQNRLFRNTGKGTFVDVTRASGLDGRAAFSTSALWFDFDRDGLLDLFVCNYVKWSAEHDVFCSLDGKQKSYCTPEAYRGDTCWLFRNRGNGTFEDVTATSGIFDSSSKSLGVAMLDDDQDGWPDLFVANDTQPNKLYRNLRNGTLQGGRRSRPGVAFSADGKARAGMGVDAADFDNSGTAGLADHQLRQRDDRPLSRRTGRGLYRGRRDAGRRRRCRRATRSASAASSPTSISTARSISSSPTATSTRPCATSAATSATRSRRSCS